MSLRDAKREIRSVALATLLCGASSAALAQYRPAQYDTQLPTQGRQEGQTLDLGLSLGATHSDNIRAVSSGEESGDVAAAGVALRYLENTRRLHADIDTDLAYEHYFDHIFDSGVSGVANGLVAVAVLPERLDWVAQDNFTQTRLNPQVAVTAANRENVNFFSTGPDFIARLGSELALRLSGRYALMDYEKSNLDGDRRSGTLALIHDFSSASSLSFNLKADRVKFDDSRTNPDYDLNSAFVGYQVRGSRTTIAADVGYTELKQLSEKSHGLLFDLSVTRRITSAQSLELRADSRISDSASSLGDANSGARDSVFSAVNILGTSDPFKARNVLVGWKFSRSRTAFGLNVTRREERYENATLFDRTLTGYGGYFTRQMSPLLELQARVNKQREKFDNTGFTGDTTEFGLGLVIKPAATLQVLLQGSRVDRDSDSVNDSYVENRVSLFLVWTPIGRPK